MRTITVIIAFVSILALGSRAASAECMCVAVAGDVDASIQASVAKADSLYARADFSGALDLYASAYASSHASALLYAQAMCKWQLGMSDDAKAMFASYLEASGNLAYVDRANAAVSAIDGGVKKAVDLGGGVAGGVVGGVRGGAEGGLGVVGGVAAKPKRVAGGVAVVLGIVAVAAIGTVAITGIRAGISDKVSFSSFDKGFAIGGGLAGVVMAGSAVYLWGLTTASASVAGACHAEIPKKLVAPMALDHGAGVTGLVRF